MSKRAKPAKPKISFEEALLALKTAKEVTRFLADVATPSEIEALTQRWWVAQLLNEHKLSYREIHKVTGASITTVTRVARFLFQEKYAGYRLVIKRRKTKR